MKSLTPNISSEDVLNAFALEPTHDRATLESYLREYPQYAIELAHLSHELSRIITEPAELSAADRAHVDEAWREYVSSSSVSVADVFATLSVPQLRELASFLGVPRQIIAAFREHRVLVGSVPRRILSRVAEGLNTSVEQVKAALSLPPVEASYARSHKSEEKPKAASPVSFEQLLIDAQVPADRRAELLSEVA